MYAPVGKCIYCGRSAVTLTDEHIVAAAIHGVWILPKASCKRCQKITTKLEGHCFAGTLKPFRTQIGMYGRKKRIPKSFSLYVQHADGRERVDELPASKFPATLVIPHFKSLPTILGGVPPTPTDTIDAWGQILWPNGGYPQYQSGTRIGIFPSGFNGGKWCRMLAKIAHSHAVAMKGVNGFKPYLQKMIRGMDNSYNHYLGGTLEIPPSDEFLHRLTINEWKSDRVPGKIFLVVTVRIFASFGTPECVAVVGEIS